MILLLFLLTLPLLPLLLAAFRAATSPLRHIPGPFLARFTRLWELSVQMTGAVHEHHIALHARYGPIVRLSPNRYSVSSPAAMKTIYGHGSAFRKAAFYDPFGGADPVHDGNLFSIRDASVHAGRRRRVAPLYALSALVGCEPGIDRCTEVLMRRFRTFACDGGAVNLGTWLQFYAYDVIGEITVGRAFGLMEAGRDRGILHAIDRYLTYASRVGLLPEWHAVLDKVAPRWQPLQSINRESKLIIDERNKALSEIKGEGGQNDFMTKVLGLMQDGRADEKDLTGVIGTNIGAGSDTTAISLSAVILQLVMNPECAQKLREEIDGLAAEGKLSDPITFKESQQMPYLQAVIKEALRLHPAVGQILPRYVPPGGAELDGTFFPGGTIVGMNAWVLHRDKVIFGTDSDKFRPERWLESKERTTKMDQHLLTFGAGSRTCIGKNISALEMDKVIPQLVRYFEFELLHLAPHQSDWFVKQDFQCRIKIRNEYIG